MNSKFIKYDFYALLGTGIIYRLIDPLEISEEFNDPITLDEHELNMKYLSGMRDGGYKLDRELRAIDVRDEKD